MLAYKAISSLLSPLFILYHRIYAHGSPLHIRNRGSNMLELLNGHDFSVHLQELT